MLRVGDFSHRFRKISSIKKLDAMRSEINFTQKRFSLRNLTETKEESLTATCSSLHGEIKRSRLFPVLRRLFAD